MRYNKNYIVRYVIRSILRNTFRSISFFAVALVLMSTLCFLQVTAVGQENKLDEVYRDMTVIVNVSDINGVADNLYIPNNYIDTFTNDSYGLSKYFEYVSFKRPMLLLNEEVQILFSTELNTSRDKARVIGISNLASESGLSEINGVKVIFFDGYDESILDGEEDVCLINEKFYDSFEQPAKTINIKAKSFDHMFTMQKPQEVERGMKIVGVIQGGKPYDIYCSWNSICDLGNLSDGAEPYTESISAIITDNNSLNEFKEKAKRYYTKVDISMGTSEYTFALTVHDSQLNNTTAAINKNLYFIRLASSVILFLSLGIGFFVCFLYTKNRKIEFALLRSLGMNRVTIVLITMLEQIILSTIALAISLPVIVLANGNEIGFAYNFVFFILFTCGGFIALYPILFSNILKAMREQ